ncbi:MAG: DUF883 family protein [Verrucomicrobiota bacterium]
MAKQKIELTEFQEAKAKLAEDLRMIASDAEELIKAGGSELAEKSKEVRDRLRQVLADAKETCARLEERAEEGVRQADQLVRNNPYRSIGIALGAGFVIGLLIGRRRD